MFQQGRESQTGLTELSGIGFSLIFSCPGSGLEKGGGNEAELRRQVRSQAGAWERGERGDREGKSDRINRIGFSLILSNPVNSVVFQ
jgi:hypothetical protein